MAELPQLVIFDSPSYAAGRSGLLRKMSPQGTGTQTCISDLVLVWNVHVAMRASRDPGMFEWYFAALPRSG